MIAHHCLFIALVSSLLTESLAVGFQCWNDPVPNPKECEGAITNIHFDTTTKPSRLPLTEGKVRTINGGCALIIKNPNRASVTEDSIRKVLDDAAKQCPGKGGRFSFPENRSVNLEIRPRAAPGSERLAFDPDFPLEKTYCYQGGKEILPITDKGACIKALENLPTDANGIIMGDDNKPATSVYKYSKSCTLYIFTTDQSLLQVVKKDVAPKITKMIQECDTKRGNLNLNGAQGPNGRVLVYTYA
ncbi:hypothetical protein Pst134EA_023004 [Puccinia striiformis f. sp. tritici]|uniref:hypothetical protein n=1 Tax=Puccinia striiformis f. sp. tritici TaxID=168172 RepID=UPI0020072165|nr:hypothetical protein Pst134EA_023004 [Puccinia striiformis f. sp. tritici]KAH9446036.1 hypothetical protein Pst134EB_023854 [Puccinia striiformis f. sp. tritici]KAH9455545.1 hypothetical protein Pst134EA_023004 [Puccinia striiformis f. sp. tritici]KAI9606129.1 hypothetical protein H4Q26_004503 [Puccinia striiformis f. sp. tritici PST-130]